MRMMRWTRSERGGGRTRRCTGWRRVCIAWQVGMGMDGRVGAVDRAGRRASVIEWVGRACGWLLYVRPPEMSCCVSFHLKRIRQTIQDSLHR